MTDVKMMADDLNALIVKGKLLEAFDKYYADDVSMQENNAAPRVGKDANRKGEEAFVNGLTEIRSIKLLGTTYGDNISTSEMFMDVTHKDWGTITKTQVAVQRWQDGKIVSEKFYYTT